MTVHRRLAALVLGLSMVAAPAAAAPGGGARSDLPEAAYVRERPTLEADRGAPSDGPRRTASAAAPRQLTAETIGGSLYVDGCTGAGGDAFDIRRTGVVMKGDRSAIQLTLRACRDSGTPLTTPWDEQAVVWQLTETDPGGASQPAEDTITIEQSGGGLAVRVDAVAAADAFVGVDTSSSPVPELVVQIPADRLDVLTGCNPTVAPTCMTVEVGTFDSGDRLRDVMPDVTSPLPVWPSACRPDIDPARAGHVRLTSTSAAAAQAVARDLTAAGYRAAAYDGAPYVDIPVGADDEVRSALQARDDVVAVEPVTPRRTTAVTPNDPRFDEQWYLDRIRVPDAWELTRGSSVGIAIVDNGVASDRDDLAGRIERGWDAVAHDGTGDGTPLPAGTHSDLGGHGTAVAGLAAAAGNDGAGMAGVDWSARIHPLRVFDHEGCFVSGPAYLEALDWLADNAASLGIRVANFSLGGSAIPGEDEAVRRIVDAGVVVVAAMGNDGDPVGATPSYPAALPEVVAVGATGPDDRLADYSNRGRHVDVVAPGGDQSGSTSGDLVTLADPVAVASGFAPLAGTSFSSPLVAGLAALYQGVHPDATPADITRALVTTARDLGPGLAGFDLSYGFGIVDAPRVLGHRPGQTAVRVAGGDRYETAVRASQHAFSRPELVDVVFLATGENYPDALAGGPLAAREHAPILLTPRDGLHGATRDELQRLSPTTVVVLGGPTAVSDRVVSELESLGVTVERAAGSDRYRTAAITALGCDPVAEDACATVESASWRAWNGAPLVYIATGENFPDALPGGAAAAANDAPLLLTARYELPDATRFALSQLRPSQVILLGGPNAIDDAVLAELLSMGIPVERAAGQTRYETAIAALCPLEELCRVDTRLAVVATGENYPDALGGSAAAAALRAPLILVPPTGAVPDVVADALEVIAAEQMVVLGGPVPIPQEMADRVAALAVR